MRKPICSFCKEEVDDVFFAGSGMDLPFDPSQPTAICMFCAEDAKRFIVANTLRTSPNAARDMITLYSDLTHPYDNSIKRCS